MGRGMRWAEGCDVAQCSPGALCRLGFAVQHVWDVCDLLWDSTSACRKYLFWKREQNLRCRNEPAVFAAVSERVICLRMFLI